MCVMSVGRQCVCDECREAMCDVCVMSVGRQCVCDECREAVCVSVMV